MTRNRQAISRVGPARLLRRIDGRHNLLLKELRRAFRQGESTTEGHFAIEGVRLIDEAIRSGCRLRAVFFSESAGERMKHLLPQISANVETLLLPEMLFQSAVVTDSPQGVAALVVVPEKASVESVVAGASDGPIIVAAGIQDPGNLGTIVRSAEAFGAAGILTVEGTVSQWNPKVIRASAGSLFRLPVAHARLKDIIPALRSAGCRLLATSSHKGTPLPEVKLTPPVAIFVGNEGAGVPKEAMAAIDEVVAIPQARSVESLNAGVATSIVLYEYARQRNQSSS